jgi:TPR repeat protein
VQRFGQACDLGNLLGCRNLGLILHGDRGVPADRAAAATAFEKACTGELPFACTNRGELDTEGDKPDYKAAVEWFKKGCNGGDPVGCRDLGIAYLEGKGLPKGRAPAEVWLKMACEHGDGVGCRLQGMITADPAAAIAIFDRGCKARDEASCTARDKLAGGGSGSAGSGTGSGSGSGSASR